MKRTNFLLVVIILLSSVGAKAQQAQNGTGLEVDAKEMQIMVEGLSPAAAEIGLTADQIKTKCELRLRQAGLKPIERAGQGFLYVSVTVTPLAYNINLAFGRRVAYSISRGSFAVIARVWNDGVTGTHNAVGAHILSQLDPLLDSFLNEFLKANPPKV